MTLLKMLLPVVCAAAFCAEPSVMLPTGQRITPGAVPGSRFDLLDPGLANFPGFRAGYAISTAISPDTKTLLVLTSGFNRNNGDDGKPIPDASNEYVFVFDISYGMPVHVQTVPVPNTFAGIVFSPSGKAFHVSGGKDDNIHSFAVRSDGKWAESGAPIALGHKSGLGLDVGKEPLCTGGLAITADGNRLVVANIYNDSVSIVDLTSRSVVKELDLRPGRVNNTQAGVAGGEYPFWVVIKGNDLAYVSSVRDREVVGIGLGAHPSVDGRIKLAGNPNKMVLDRSQTRLFVMADNSDTVTVIDTSTNRIVETIPTTASGPVRYKGSAPNDAALSPDERTLYVTNGGANSVAIIRLGKAGSPSRVTGLLPTGWYPNAVSVSGDGRMLYVANGKSVPGPNPELHMTLKDTQKLQAGPAVVVNAKNQYILQLERAGFLTMPVPDDATLARMTRLVAENNSFDKKADPGDAAMMEELRRRIKHVIYVIKENRTYDQVLGDLGRGNGDPTLTEFGERITPNFHKIARKFVALDNFFNSGEVSGDGWPWSISGRESDFGVKAVVLQYADRGTNYEYEGTNRNINVGLATLAERKTANPKTPDDPDLLPGAVNVAEPDGPSGTPPGKGHIWDAVLRAGLAFREYGCMSDNALDVPRERYPFKKKLIVSRPANPELAQYGDPYYRGFDPGYPDFYREAEWEREFDDYEKQGNLPEFELVQLPVDHMGDFESAIDDVNTPERQQADNDYGFAKLVARVAHSRYKDDTLIFSIEDDSQDGPDHVDAHRTTAYVVGPYVKQGAVVSTYYTTVNMVRTIEDLLGLDHLNLNTAAVRPMSDVFDLKQKDWNFEATPSAILAETKLPIPGLRKAAVPGSSHDAAYWAAKTQGFDFRGEDRVDADRFNRIVWEGLMGGRPYPERTR